MPERIGLVLAAGLGRRLAPVTDYVPKPLLPLLGRSLLDRAADALLAAGCERIVVNAHHRADQILAHVDSRPDRERFRVSVEPEILGTGGVFDGARRWLADAGTIVTFNGDVHCSLDLAPLVATHRHSGNVATLVLVDRPEINTVRVGADGTVLDLADRRRPPRTGGERDLTFSGIACYDGAFLDQVPAGYSDLVTILCALIDRDPTSVGGHVHAGVWQDLGTLPRYLAAHRERLGPGFVSLGLDARVPADARLDECVVLPGGWVPAAARLTRAVVGRGWAVSSDPSQDPWLELARTAGFTGDVAMEWISGHGSDRRFVRLRQDDRRAVLMAAPAGDQDHDRTVKIASFLYDAGLGAAAVLAHDARRRSILFEDLGTDSLNRLVAADPPGAHDLYARVLDRLADLQTFGVEARHRCPLAWDRAFDRAHLRWETDYFRQRFLKDLAGVAARAARRLDGEFADLASACLDQPRTLVHRDFQSQNILVKDGVVRLVDVQGMRWGPIAYDAMALLYDPYVDLDLDDRDRWLATFPDRLRARGGRDLSADQWRALTTAAGLQRLMQALGAYAFLGRVKGREEFLLHIPRALALLRRLVSKANETAGEPAAPPPMTRLGEVLADLSDDWQP